VRNFRVMGGFVPFRSNFGLELAVGNNPSSDGRTHASDDLSTFVHPFANVDERLHLAAVGELAYMREKRDAAVNWIRSHPREFLELSLRRFRLFWFPTVDLWSTTSAGRGFKAAVFSVIGVLALAELVWLLVNRHRHAALLFCAALGPSIPYIVTHVDPRYRYPVFGLTTLLAACFVTRIASVTRNKDCRDADFSPG
jgi:hypothetical protein